MVTNLSLGTLEGVHQEVAPGLTRGLVQAVVVLDEAAVAEVVNEAPVLPATITATETAAHLPALSGKRKNP
jgi:hypothetical protein